MARALAAAVILALCGLLFLFWAWRSRRRGHVRYGIVSADRDGDPAGFEGGVAWLAVLGVAALVAALLMAFSAL